MGVREGYEKRKNYKFRILFKAVFQDDGGAEFYHRTFSDPDHCADTVQNR